MLFAMALRRFIRTGSLRLTDAGGRRHVFGDGGTPTVAIRLHDRRLHTRLALDPGLSVGEAYMDGSLTVEDGTLYDFLELAARNFDNLGRNPLWGIARRLGQGMRQRNPQARARANVAHHYDLSDRLYELFLDADRQYSCAYFVDPDDSLERAQANKKRHIAGKLRLDRPGLRVLDIGSGWGGLALYLAAETGAEVTGVTLSVEQHRASQARAAAAGLGARVRFELRDYREVAGRFDRIVSVGMFEHVGKRHYGEFFAKLRDLLAEDGVALLHSIGYADTPAPINPFIRKYIFPGADLPSLSEVLLPAERSRLMVTDVEVLRLHYAETLRAWRRGFMANREAAARLYDERFCRMWEYYLALCEVGFRHRSSMVFQMQLTRRLDAAPLTRDYMLDWERAHAPAEGLGAAAS